jgi:hypothetical protein
VSRLLKYTVLFAAAAKPSNQVILAQAGVQKSLKSLDSRLRGNDAGEHHAGLATASFAARSRTKVLPNIILSRVTGKKFSRQAGVDKQRSVLQRLAKLLRALRGEADY